MKLEQALAPLVESLAADGYEATIAERDGLVTFRISAGPDACADCLSPRPVMEPIILHALRANGIESRLQLEYPAG